MILEHKKIIDAGNIRPRIAFLKAAKGASATVGYAGGAFDMLHPGHILFLNKAKEQCDILVAGVVSDARVKRLKGEDRPLYNQHIRAFSLASLECTDVVVHLPYNPSGDIVPVEYDGFFREMGADVAIFGIDYNASNLPPYRKQYARKAVFIRHPLNMHTTDLIGTTGGAPVASPIAAS